YPSTSPVPAPLRGGARRRRRPHTSPTFAYSTFLSLKLNVYRSLIDPVCRNLRSIFSASRKCQHIVNSGDCERQTCRLCIQILGSDTSRGQGDTDLVLRCNVDERSAGDAAERVAIG